MSRTLTGTTRGRPSRQRLASIVGALAITVAACGTGAGPAARTAQTPTQDEAPAPTGSMSTAPGQQSPGPPSEALSGRVVDVIDGDTVRIDFGDATESVRLIGIDTPEPSGGFQPTECFGDEASAFTRELIPPGSEVLVTFDTELRDRFDRLLGYIYRADDGLFINLSIIENGLAGQMTIEPNSTFSGLFAAAAAEADRAGLGLWQACDGPDDLVDS